ncbi:MAG: flavin reductase [Solirubrobacterales bacterium]
MEPIEELDTSTPIWARVFTVAPLVVVGTKEPDGSFDLAPKHMAMPLGWQNIWCFVCSPRHATHANALEHGEFTASFLRPEQMVEASLAAGPRDAEGSKPSLAGLSTSPAREVDGVLLDGAGLWLECELERIIDGFGENSLIIGRVVAASAPESAIRSADTDDADLLRKAPLTAYLSPGRFASVGETLSFPYHVDSRF